MKKIVKNGDSFELVERINSDCNDIICEWFDCSNFDYCEDCPLKEISAELDNKLITEQEAIEIFNREVGKLNEQ